MIPKRKIMRSTQQQLAKMLDYMSNNKDFANGEYTGPMGKRINLKEWESLQEMLNAAGPAKTVEQWRNTWRDMKKRAREEGARVRRARAETGNLPVPDLSDQSSEILKIIGTACAFGIGDNETGVGELITGQIYTTQRIHPETDNVHILSQPAHSPPTSQTFRHWMDRHPTPSSRRISLLTHQQTDPQDPNLYIQAQATNPPPTAHRIALTEQPTDLQYPDFYVQAQDTNPTPTSTDRQTSPQAAELFISAQFAHSPPTSIIAQATKKPPASTDRQTSPQAAELLIPAQFAHPPATSTDRRTRAAHTRPTSHRTTRERRVRNPGPRDFLESDKLNTEVLKDITNNLKELTSQQALKNRRDHQERLRARRFKFRF